MSGGPRAADGGPSAVFPFGGDVTQAINPWRWWFDTMTQIGLINIRVGRTPDEDLERRITEEVASYGRQLGRLSEALDSVIRATCEADGRLDASRLSDEDIARIVAFRDLLREIDRVKDDRG
jgi:hypothetical protein